MTNKSIAAVACWPLWTFLMRCWCGPDRWYAGLMRLIDVDLSVGFKSGLCLILVYFGSHICLQWPHLLAITFLSCLAKHSICHITFYPASASFLMYLQYVHSSSGLSLSPFPTFLVSFALAHVVGLWVTRRSSERDHPPVQLPSTLASTPSETLPKEWPGTGKPLLQFKQIPLPFYLLLFGCRGNVLHSDLGALIQSARYLPQEPR